MKITIHQETPTIKGMTATGQWVERRNGEWVAIDPPAAMNVSTAEKTPPLSMTDPYVRKTAETRVAARVTIVHAVEKVVYDYEAEVLARNGWVILPVCPDCHAAHFGNIDCINCRAFHGITFDPDEFEHEA